MKKINLKMGALRAVCFIVLLTMVSCSGSGGGGGGEASPEVTINHFEANPDFIIEGNSSILSWDVRGVNQITISPGVGTFPSTGSIAVSPTTSTNFSIQAGGQSKQANVGVGNLPRINTALSSRIIESGDSVLLSWSTMHTNYLSIDQGIGSVVVNGDITVYPDSYTTYTFRATNQYGTTLATESPLTRSPASHFVPFYGNRATLRADYRLLVSSEYSFLYRLWNVADWSFIDVAMEAGEMNNIDLWPSGLEWDVSIQQENVTQFRGVIIDAPIDIAVVGINNNRHSTDFLNTYPISDWGTRYRIAQYYDRRREFVSVGHDDAFLQISAQEDGTQVTLRPAYPIRLVDVEELLMPDAPLTFTLDAFETRTFTSSRPYASLFDHRGFVGATVEADLPVAVYAGSPCAFVHKRWCDHMVEQLPPVSMWESRYLVPQLPLSNWTTENIETNITRTILIGDNPVTNIAISFEKNGAIEVQEFTLFEGDNMYFDMQKATEIVADGPIFITQYRMGDGCIRPGDPFMLTVQPTSRYRTLFRLRIPFLRNEQEVDTRRAFPKNTISVIAEQGDADMGAVLLNGISIPAENFSRIADSEYAYAYISLEAWMIPSGSTYTVESLNPIGVYAFGFDSCDSYAYFGAI